MNNYKNNYIENNIPEGTTKQDLKILWSNEKTGSCVVFHNKTKKQYFLKDQFYKNLPNN